MAKIVTTFPKTVRVIEHSLIPLKDGTTPGGSHLVAGGC